MVNPLRATKYTGMNQIYAAPVSHPRRPTTADYRNPENAKLYRISTVWQVSKNPSDGVEGELWMLSKIVANVATWVLISGGNVGTVVSVTGDDGVVTQPDGGGNIDLVGNVVGNATHPKPLYVQTGGANTEQWDIQLAAAVAPTPLDANDAGIASFNNTQFSVDPTSGMVSLVDPVDADLHVARFIVSGGGTADGANYTTIADAITAAVLVGGSQTIAIQPGTYAENFTLPASINLTAFPCDAFSGSVNISGTITCSDAGTRSLSGLRLSSNAATILSVTGVATTNVRLINCFINGTNGAGIVNSSNGGGIVSLFYCFGSVGGANAVFALTGSNTLNLYYSQLTGSTTASTVGSGCDLSVTACNLLFPISTSGTGAIGVINSLITSTVTSLTIGGTGGSRVSSCIVGGPGAVAAITIAAGCTLTITLSEIVGATPNVITGAGTINRGLLVFTGTGSTITTATQNALVTI